MIIVRVIKQSRGLFDLNALMNEQRSVAAVIDNQVWPGTVRPAECLLGTPPILFERFSLPGKNSGLVL